MSHGNLLAPSSRLCLPEDLLSPRREREGTHETPTPRACAGGRTKRRRSGGGHLLLGINNHEQGFIWPNSRAGWGTSRLGDLAICQGGRAAGRIFCQIASFPLQEPTGSEGRVVIEPCSPPLASPPPTRRQRLQRGPTPRLFSSPPRSAAPECVRRSPCPKAPRSQHAPSVMPTL